MASYRVVTCQLITALTGAKGGSLGAIGCSQEPRYDGRTEKAALLRGQGDE